MANKEIRRIRIFAWVGVVIGLVLVVSLSRNIFRLVRQAGRLQQARDRVAQLEAEKKELENQKDYFQSSEFVETEARNRLNMSRPDEAVVVLPSPEEETVSARVMEGEKPGWKKWLEYFGIE